MLRTSGTKPRTWEWRIPQRHSEQLHNNLLSVGSDFRLGRVLGAGPSSRHLHIARATPRGRGGDGWKLSNEDSKPHPGLEGSNRLND
jgi:hypothetical protein